MSGEPVRVGVLSLHESKETKAICNAIEALGHEPVWLREENTVGSFDRGRADLEPDVDVIANRLLLSTTDQPAAAIGIAQTLDRLRPMLNRPEATAPATSGCTSSGTAWSARCSGTPRRASGGRTSPGAARSRTRPRCSTTRCRRAPPGPSRPRSRSPSPSGSPSIGFTEHVAVAGTSGTRTVVAESDTGAARTSIDLRLAAEIGAGPIHTVTRVRSGTLAEGRARPVVDLVVGLGGHQHTVAANVEDRSHMTYPVLLGRDVLKHYRLDVSRRVDAEPTAVPVEGEEE